MSSGNYNSYNNYPYQQSPAHFTSVSNNLSPPPSRPYHTTPATQSTDYSSYQAQNYNAPAAIPANAYSGTQNNAWGSNSYGGNREMTSEAAKVLQNLSNTSYGSSSNTASNSVVANTASTTSYSSNFSKGHSHSHQPTQHQPSRHEPLQHRPSTGQSAIPSPYEQSPARPRSVNTNCGQVPASRGLHSPAPAATTSQRASTSYSQQPHRSSSPASSNHNYQAPATSASNAAISAGTQYPEYNRQLPDLNVSRAPETAVSTSTADYSVVSTPTSVTQTRTNVSETITVDPMAVYDPWPEYHRKKAVQDAARAAEDARMAEERKEEEEKKKVEEEERMRQASLNKSTTSDASSGSASEDAQAHGMESEIRALMQKMREYNSKDPALLARIWEEERRAKAAPKPPTAATAPAAPTTQAPSESRAAQSSNSQATARRKKSPLSTQSPTIQKTKAFANQSSVRSPVPAPVPAVPATLPARSVGTTIWPHEKRAILATTAAAYISENNPHIDVRADHIIRILHSNPTYLEMCEQLESLGVRLDRAMFAKRLLAAAPDLNSSQKKPAQVTSNVSMTPSVAVAPPAVMKREINTPSTSFANQASAAPSLSYPAFSSSTAQSIPRPAPVAEMIHIKPELKRSANKEEAARKHNFNDLIDLTQADENDFEPPPKRLHIEPNSGYSGGTQIERHSAPSANFPLPARATPQPVMQPPSMPPPSDLRNKSIVQPLDRKKALRRNTYNIKTIARDVLLACGRHPEERQLNGHLDILKSTLLVGQDSDLSTLRWDLIDPGKPPQGYFKQSIQAFADNSEDDLDSDEDNERESKRARLSSLAHPSESSGHQKHQAHLPEAVNPFKQAKRRGRPPRQSLPIHSVPTTPERVPTKSMSASAPRAASSGVGYSAFRAATEYDANGNPLPKKKGRPVGWRKHIHGSAALSQARTGLDASTAPNQSGPSQRSASHIANSVISEPIRIESSSPSIPNRVRHYQSFRCKWQNCKAELHNLATLRLHVTKVHRNASPKGFVECHWTGCGTDFTTQDALGGAQTERVEPISFTTEARWKQHLEQSHFSPLSWDLGDGPASGVSDTTDSEAYLSDAHGRRVTPKIIARPPYVDASGANVTDDTGNFDASAFRSRGRPPKDRREQEVRQVQTQLVAHKKRLGGPGMDRGGATLVNEKRRRGLIENDLDEEELVDTEC